MLAQPKLIIGSRHIETGRDNHEMINPATEDVSGTCPIATAQDTLDALEAAKAGLAVWRREPGWRRSEILRKASGLLRERLETIAETITREVGKPLAEARAEAMSAVEHFDWCADEARRLYDHSFSGRVAGTRLEVRHEPVGVVLALTAWNFPIGLAARKLAMALAAGCSVVLRPALEAPATATLLVQCCIDAGLPEGAVNLLHGDPETTVAPLMSAPDVRKISFTGSTRVGQLLMQQSAETLKKMTMELGGHAPFIVLGDVDVDHVAAAAVAGKFRNAGQVCTSPTRFIVDASIADEFSEKFARGASELKIGNGLEDGVQVGPLTTARQLAQAERLVADARAKGASILSGGKRPEGFNRGFFYEPTVIGDPSPDAEVLHIEPFAPVAVVQRANGTADAISKANSLEYGLAAYVFSRSREAIEEVTGQIEAGVVGANTTVVALPEAPFGGVKQSGFGREGGSEGPMEYLVTKFIHTHPAA